MTMTDHKDIGAIIRDGRLIDEAITAAHAEVVRRHRQLGARLVLWRDGRVVEVTADEFDQMESAKESANRNAEIAGGAK